jgi:hypothetical protein
VSGAPFLTPDARRELDPLVELARGALAAPAAPASVRALRQALAAAPLAALARATTQHLPPACAPGARAWISHDLLEAKGGRVNLFLLPAGGVIPLHDHPDMIVLLRVVLGRLRVTSLDWVDRRALLARRAGERLVGVGDDVLAADPTDRNVHAVEALEPSAFLDVLTPDYADERPCTYFAGAAAASADGLVRLRAVPPP